ncbi:hypothetical protein [Chryseobacterium jejuense]|uniref:Uncharacterized protein n=1 Tax=Chryseobacterium jejuense TaxID=445960 RepID=A0A2X2VVS8_CHRJE|nr:hypothetical protein [Chryseobacterium jejuense]SDI82052.1 hypothetical protein SAMN05421542_1910 [Chryseobacterium jejuense]SQB27725.1 Uncharacterised protein [Chryseobacterium jejuense]
MKKYKAKYHQQQFVMVDEKHAEVGRIVEVRRLFFLRHYIILNSRSYDIKNVGFLKNDVELFNGKDVVYFTDLAKERIIKSGQNLGIYYFKLKSIHQLFEEGKLLIELKKEKVKSKEPVFHIEADDTADDLLILLFLHYSTKEFNGIGGDD